MSTVVNRFADANSLADDAAEQFVALLGNLVQTRPTVNVMLTGGTIGIATLAAIATVPELSSFDFSKVHFWWGDERYVASDSPERNALQARRALLNKVSVPESNIHEFPSLDSGLGLNQAAQQFEAVLDELKPTFDFAFVGMGPDGHICSLFPGHDLPDQNGQVIAEDNSPKPPAQRLSFSFGVMNSVDEVWFVVAGADKADAVSCVFGDDCQLPAAKVKGRSKTVWFVDQTAGAKTWGC